MGRTFRKETATAGRDSFVLELTKDGFRKAGVEFAKKGLEL